MILNAPYPFTKLCEMGGIIDKDAFVLGTKLMC